MATITRMRMIISMPMAARTAMCMSMRVNMLMTIRTNMNTITTNTPVPAISITAPEQPALMRRE